MKHTSRGSNPPLFNDRAQPAGGKRPNPDEEASPWSHIEMGLLREHGRGDLSDIDPDVCGGLEAQPEDAGGLQ